MNKLDPRLVGYWAFRNGLAWEDVIYDTEVFGVMDSSSNNPLMLFNKGWNEAADEVRASKMISLKQDLAILIKKHEQTSP